MHTMRLLQRLQCVIALTGTVKAGVIFSSLVQHFDVPTTSVQPAWPSTSTATNSTVRVATAISPNLINTKTRSQSPSATIKDPLPPVSADLFPDTAPKWYLHDHDVPSAMGNLPQMATNGRSRLGLFDAPQYKHHLNYDTGTPDYPWGNRTALDTDPYHGAPDTGMVRRYNLTIGRGLLAPDGVPRPVILVNDQFPGPTLEANWGDWFEITVINNITGPEEGTSVHWHGILQKDMPWEDGVPGISQCPLAPGESFTYRFRADLYGSSWYHAHYSAQYAAGAFGAMIIHGPSDNAKYDTDLGPVLISDYYHDSYFDLLEQTMGTNPKKVVVFSDNNLINGKGIFNCSYASDSGSCDPNAGLSKFRFEQGKAHRLRLINAGAEGLQKFSIDGHRMKVIAYDFVPIVPHETEIVTLHVGQRADVIVVADGDANGVYWMRSSMTKCSNTNQPNALAMVYYDGADSDATPNSEGWADETDPCANDDLSTAVPYYPMNPVEDPETELEIDIQFGKNATGHYVWTMNNSTFRTNFNAPIMPLVQNGAEIDEFPREWNVYDIGKSASTRITLNNKTPVSHPIHLHGHNMFVLSSTNGQTPSGHSGRPSSHDKRRVPPRRGSLTSKFGFGSDADPELNFNNPTRRDTHILPPNGQMVLQFDGDNPGVWPLHCHVAWHVSGGLYVNILEDAEALKAMDMGDSKSKMDGLCQKWQQYTDSVGQNGEVIDVIDSGLKRMLEKDR